MFSFQSGLLGVWQKKDCFCFSLTFSFSPFLAFFFPLSLSLFLVARQVRWVGWDFSGKFLVIMGFGGGGVSPFSFHLFRFFFPLSISLSLVAWLWEWTLIVSIVSNSCNDFVPFGRLRGWESEYRYVLHSRKIQLSILNFWIIIKYSLLLAISLFAFDWSFGMRSKYGWWCHHYRKVQLSNFGFGEWLKGIVASGSSFLTVRPHFHYSPQNKISVIDQSIRARWVRALGF